MPHRLDQIARHARELEQLRHLHPGERADDLVHVATGTEISSGATEYNALDLLFALETKEKISQLGIRLECQGILALRAVQGDDADPAFDAPEEMLGLDHEVTSTACCFTLARSLSSSSCSRRERPASSSTTHSSCARAISPKLRSPALVSRMQKARRSARSASRSASPSFSRWATMAVAF